MGKAENIKNYYKKKYFEKIEKDIENSKFKNRHTYNGNWDKAFHNCHTRTDKQKFRGLLSDFKLKIESLFKVNMTWENYGEWEIDHIIPLSKGGEHDVNNLQPLWKNENRRKYNKLDFVSEAN